MTVELRAGTLSVFFASAKETAKEIDEGRIKVKGAVLQIISLYATKDSYGVAERIAKL